jgi:hypothetical protein
MKKYKQNVKRLIPSILLTIIVLTSPITLSAQTEDFRSLTKIGGYPLIRHGGLNGYIISLEHERVFKKHQSFTHGPRIDYYMANASFNYPTFFLGTKNLIFGYEIKVYPFHFIFDKPYQGVFIGVFACYLTPIDSYYKNGPGIATPIGYQYVFKNRISLGAEATMVYFKNVNLKAFDRSNPAETYFFFLASIKLGIKFNFREGHKRKVEKI